MPQPSLLLLHGALGTAAQFEPLLPFLTDHFILHRLDFEGHGEQPPVDRPFRIEHFAENVTAWLDAHGIEQTDIFGYSMGGYVAAYLAKIAPQRVRRVMTLGTKYLWTRESATTELGMLDPDTIEMKVPRFARALEAQHTGAGWREVLARTREMIQSLGEHNLLDESALAKIEHPVRVAVGDRDNTVGVEESRSVFRALPSGQLAVLPNTSHPLEKAPTDLLAKAIIDFFVGRSV